jgi:hypothetical protein
MEPISVDVRFEESGQIIPMQFTWRGSVYSVSSVGRSWQDGENFHFMVMSITRTFELLWDTANHQWRLVQPSRSARLA